MDKHTETHMYGGNIQREKPQEVDCRVNNRKRKSKHLLCSIKAKHLARHYSVEMRKDVPPH